MPLYDCSLLNTFFSICNLYLKYTYNTYSLHQLQFLIMSKFYHSTVECRTNMLITESNLLLQKMQIDSSIQHQLQWTRDRHHAVTVVLERGAGT
jgi:hypothetical protein